MCPLPKGCEGSRFHCLRSAAVCVNSPHSLHSPRSTPTDALRLSRTQAGSRTRRVALPMRMRCRSLAVQPPNKRHIFTVEVCTLFETADPASRRLGPRRHGNTTQNTAHLCSGRAQKMAHQARTTAGVGGLTRTVCTHAVCTGRLGLRACRCSGAGERVTLSTTVRASGFSRGRIAERRPALRYRAHRRRARAAT